MRGSSRGSAKAVQAAFDTALAGDPAWATLAEELFAVTGVVDGSASLRRALADPSREGPTSRAWPVRSSAARSVRPPPASSPRSPASAGRPSATWPTPSRAWPCSRCSPAAERERRIDRVEDELFRFERIVAGDPGLRDTLSSRNTDGAGKATLVHGLLEGKAAPETVRLAEQAVREPRGRRLDRVLEAYLTLASQRRDELAALVTVAAPLTAQQQRPAQQRARGALRQAGHPPGRPGPRGHGRHPHPGRRRGRRRHRPAAPRRGPPARHRRLTGIRPHPAATHRTSHAPPTTDFGPSGGR